MLLENFKKALYESCLEATVAQEKYGPYKDQMIVNLYNGYGVSVIGFHQACPYFMIKSDMIPIQFQNEFCTEWKTVGDPITNPEISDFLDMIETWSKKEIECE